MKYFYFSIILGFAACAVAWAIGGVEAAYICALLAVLEISLSFDNAVVNAKVLEGMSETWRRRFFVYGIPVAVFGMRFLFPVLIVAIVAHLGLGETFMLALNDPESYHAHLAANKNEIYAFGGAFLLLVALEFFFSPNEVHWIGFIENNALVRVLAGVNGAAVFASVLAGVALTLYTDDAGLAVAYFGAVALHIALGIFGEIFGGSGAARTGLAGFLYLETLDASFSFDGVIGAFAMSENIFIIMLGLGVGAMFVRSLTLYMVERGVLEAFCYLEHGAHYAILALALIMFVDIFHEVGEAITGTIGFGFIFAAFLCSLARRRRKMRMKNVSDLN